MYRNKFKRFGGEWIPDIIEYLKNQIEKNPDITISVGCDSIQKRRRTIYACTIMMYNNDIRNGAHVVFFRENQDKVRDNHERLHKEAQMAFDIAEFLNTELSDFYSRKDLNDFQKKSYKFHLMKCSGDYDYIQPSDLDRYINNIFLTESEKNTDYKLVDIHLDFNPFETTVHSRGRTNNKSNVAYKAYVPWLRGMNYRVYAKNVAFAASSAADLLLQD